MKIINQTRNAILSSKGQVANTPFARMMGLLNRKVFLSGEALVITHCQSIHMLFMRFSIDVIFVNKNHQVVGLVERIKPFQFSPIFIKANFAIEFPEGTIAQTKTVVGDFIGMETEKELGTAPS